MQHLAPGEIKEVLSLLQTALDLPAQQRGTWIEGLDRPIHLKTTVAELLERQAQYETDDFLRRVAQTTSSEGNQGVAPAAPPFAGALIGPYRLLQLIGEGGMSSVWLAERDDGVLRRKVALKLPHWWALSKLTDRAIRERDILASLEHPNIARLYDAGITSDGRPFLALEYIEGKPIDEFCEQQNLDVRSRVALLARVARAVAFAHSRLVVHRDLKPSNILVDSAGEVHLLDFGIAKLIEEGSSASKALTQIGARVLTPEYASPEQLAGDAITTESDVYSLGVIAYELLAGTRPYSFKNAASADWAVLASEIRPPGASATDPARARALRGDLDTIVLKALKQEPGERYTSAAMLADDLDRYLRGDPVLAQPDSATYRLRKFAARNQLAVSAAVAIVLALATGLFAATWQLRIARAEKQRAEEVKEFVASIFRSADPFFTGSQQMTAAELLTLAKDRVDREMASQPENATELLLIVGEAQLNLERLDEARSTLQAAVESASHSSSAGGLHAILARAQLASIHAYEREHDDAERELDAVIPQLRRHGDEAARILVNALLARAFVAGDRGDFERAIGDTREAMELSRRALGEHDSETIMATRQLAQELLMAGRIDESVEIARAAHQSALTNFGAGGRNGLLVETEDMYGRALADSGQLEKGIAHLQNALAKAEALFGPNHSSVSSKLSWLARAQMKLGDLDGAVESMKRSVRLAPTDHDRARAAASLGVALVAARRIDEALEVLRAAVSDLRRVDTGEGSWLPNATATLGNALALAGRSAEAERVLRANLQAKHVAPAALADTHNGLGFAALNDDPKAALPHFREALQNAGPPDPPSRIRAAALLGMGLAHLAAGNLDEADRALQEADTAHAKLSQRITPSHADVLLARGRLAVATQRKDEAARLIGSAHTFWQSHDPTSTWARDAARLHEEAISIASTM